MLIFLDRVIANSYSLHWGIVSPDPFVMKLSNKNKKFAASHFCPIDSILFKIILDRSVQMSNNMTMYW